jgi:oligopeptidase B
VLAYLRAENAYYERTTARYRGLVERLTREMIGRVDPRDETVPYRDRGYLYYRRYAPGAEHPLYLRRPAGGGEEQVLIDAPREAAGHDYYDVGGFAVSARGRHLAFLEDTAGRYQYTLRIRDLRTGRDLPERIPGLRDTLAWANDDRTVYYIENDPVTLLSRRVRKHVLGTDPAHDPVVYEEKDTSFYLSLRKTGDHRFVTLELESTVANEWWALDADAPDSGLRVLAPRRKDFHYDADHAGDRWVFRTDWDAPNYRLMTAPDAALGDRGRWTELVPHDAAVFIEGIALFRGHVAINERREGLLGIRIVAWDAPARPLLVRSDEPVYVAKLSDNAEQETETLRYTYTSLTTPPSEYEVDMRTGERRLLKRKSIRGGFLSEDYRTERGWARARDGALVPLSIVYRKGFRRDGTAPLLLYAYGAYGDTSTAAPEFYLPWISLLDRGFVCAIAHVRGGQEMGRAWYEDGKLLKKKNTFTDFVDATDHLVREKYAAPDKVFASGLSAGGLLMGVVLNAAPEKYRAIVAEVPFVDAVTTMLDESIPLTANEFDEWGDPRQKAYYDYLLSYSPYDNVGTQAYPALFVTTGLWDSQVQYYEPAKWVARLRAARPGPRPLLFRVDMTSGHGGSSGRFSALADKAEQFAFLLDVLGRRN